LQSRNDPLAEIVARNIVASRPVPESGKAEDSCEETVKCIMNTTGIRIQAFSERISEITLGKTHDQQGLAATCKD
jgi:hypothetical protein